MRGTKARRTGPRVKDTKVQGKAGTEDVYSRERANTVLGNVTIKVRTSDKGYKYRCETHGNLRIVGSKLEDLDILISTIQSTTFPLFPSSYTLFLSLSSAKNN